MDYEQPDPSAAHCTCTGLRYCIICVNSDRVKGIREDAEKNGVELARSVFEKNKQHLPQSSCAFSALPSISPMAWCAACGTIFVKPLSSTADVYLDSNIGCSAHQDGGWDACKDIEFKGLFGFPGLIDENYEADLSDFLDGKPRRIEGLVLADEDGSPIPSPFPGWKDSQSGRRKQDFGPAPNFKKRKVKSSDLPGMPLELKHLLTTIMSEVDRVTVNPDTELPPFVIAQASCLDYDSAVLSNLDPHVDDVWLWGPRVAGVSLLAGCIMTFVREDGAMVDVHLPRRWGFVLSGESRFQWLHGIRHSGIQGRRLSITMRELAPGAGLDDEIKSTILNFAQHYV
jgi:DNA N6-methyl adenine demethylase